MAAREGASVIVLESQSGTSFSSTAVCKGNYCVIGSDEQKAAGIDSNDEGIPPKNITLSGQKSR